MFWEPYPLIFKSLFFSWQSLDITNKKIWLSKLLFCCELQEPTMDITKVNFGHFCWNNPNFHQRYMKTFI